MTPPMHYVDPPDCPEGMTLAAWRASKRETARPRGVLARLRARKQRRGGEPSVAPRATAPVQRAA